MRWWWLLPGYFVEDRGRGDRRRVDVRKYDTHSPINQDFLVENDGSKGIYIVLKTE